MMALLSLILVLCPLCENAPTLSGTGQPEKDYETILREGIDAFYRTDWQRAERLFNGLQEQRPEDPRAWFFEAMIPFWDYFFGMGGTGTARRFLELSSEALIRGEEWLDRHPTDTTTVLLMSGLYGYRSLIAASEKRYRTALESGMTGYRYTRQLLALDSADPRALIGKGVFRYMLGSVPGGVRWMTNMAGLKGDRKEGLELLRRASRSDSHVRNDALMILAYLHEKEGRAGEAIAYLERLQERYPCNLLVLYNRARLQEELGRTRQAQELYGRAAGMDNPGLQELIQESARRMERLDTQ
ncbi:MAG: tetratricopeptide repeat protein [Balneolaceae bacterium]|nr:tetratricopeptide repeat protein [Balneolaceae bacterium]